MKNKKIKWIVIIAVILIVVFIGFKFVTNRTTNKTDATENLNNEVEYTVIKDNISTSVAESGNVNPTDKRIIKSEIDGTVYGIYVTEGDVIEKDQMIISLESDTTRSD